MNNILKFSLVLFLVNLIAAAILASVYHVTKPKIEQQQHLIEEEALTHLMPQSVGDRLEPVEKDGELYYWKVFKGAGNKPSGYVFISKEYGYSSTIETMVGMKSDGTITGVRILSQNETPGLGAKIIEIQSQKTVLNALREVFSGKKESLSEIQPYFTEQFKDWNIRKIELSKSGIQAITGATISSKAVVDSVKSRGLEMLNVKQ